MVKKEMLMYKDKFKEKITEASLKIILVVLSDKSVLWRIKNGVIQNMKAKKLDDLKKIVDKYWKIIFLWVTNKQV